MGENVMGENVMGENVSGVMGMSFLVPDHAARDMFICAMRKAVSTVCVVATAGPTGRFGVTVSAMTSVAADPPSVLVCIKRGNFVIPAATGNGCFAVNFLREGQEEIADVFAANRFSCAEWISLATGSPILAEAAASFDCILAEQVEFGSHPLLIGSALEGKYGRDPPLLYHNREYVRLAS